MSARGKFLSGPMTGLDEKPAIFTAPTRTIDGTRKVKALHGQSNQYLQERLHLSICPRRGQGEARTAGIDKDWS